MIRWDRTRYPEICEGLLQLAVAQYVQWWRNYVIPNLCLFHEMDVAVLTRAGCLWEFEIKVSQRDWDKDFEKDVRGDHWRVRRNLQYVDRFYYVVAPGLIAPEWLPEWAGILRAEVGTGWYGYDGDCIRLTSERDAKRRRAEKPTEKHRAAMLRSAYHRFWSRTMALPNAPELVADLEPDSPLRKLLELDEP